MFADQLDPDPARLTYTKSDPFIQNLLVNVNEIKAYIIIESLPSQYDLYYLNDIHKFYILFLGKDHEFYIERIMVNL